MAEPETIPANWLNELPANHKFPIWRWITFPATTLMAYRSKGYWISGSLTASDDGLTFTAGKLAALGRRSGAWFLPWDKIEDVEFQSGTMIDRALIRHDGGTALFRSARSSGFFEKVQAASSAGQSASARNSTFV